MLDMIIQNQRNYFPLISDLDHRPVQRTLPLELLVELDRSLSVNSRYNELKTLTLSHETKKGLLKIIRDHRNMTPGMASGREKRVRNAIILLDDNYKDWWLPMEAFLTLQRLRDSRDTVIQSLSTLHRLAKETYDVCSFRRYLITSEAEAAHMNACTSNLTLARLTEVHNTVYAEFDRLDQLVFRLETPQECFKDDYMDVEYHELRKALHEEVEPDGPENIHHRHFLADMEQFEDDLPEMQRILEQARDDAQAAHQHQ